MLCLKNLNAFKRLRYFPCALFCVYWFSPCDNFMFQILQARNIAVCVEFRDSDDLDAKPVRSIYGRPGMSIFRTSASVPVLHHSQSPDFYEEVWIPSTELDRENPDSLYLHV